MTPCARQRVKRFIPTGAGRHVLSEMVFPRSYSGLTLSLRHQEDCSRTRPDSHYCRRHDENCHFRMAASELAGCAFALAVEVGFRTSFSIRRLQRPYTVCGRPTSENSIHSRKKFLCQKKPVKRGKERLLENQKKSRGWRYIWLLSFWGPAGGQRS